MQRKENAGLKNTCLNKYSFQNDVFRYGPHNKTSQFYNLAKSKIYIDCSQALRNALLIYVYLY